MRPHPGFNGNAAPDILQYHSGPIFRERLMTNFPVSPGSVASSAPSSGAPAAVPTAAARDRVIDGLSRHFAADGMTIEEFERRVEEAYRSATMAELDALVADVPGFAAPARDAVALARDGTVPAEGRLVAVLSSNERRGGMIVPRHLKIVAVMGNVELDLRDATFGPGYTEIEAFAVMGNIEITVPAGAIVESTGNALLGNFASQHVSAAAPQGSPIIIRVSGLAVMSNVEAKTLGGRRLKSSKP